MCFFFFLQFLFTVTQTFTWFYSVHYAQKYAVKRSNKHNHLRGQCQTFTLANKFLKGPILNPRGSYTDEQHSFTRHYALHYTIQKARKAVTGYIERKKKLSLHNMAKF